MNERHQEGMPLSGTNLTPKIKPRTSTRDNVISTKFNDLLHVYECDILEDSSSLSILAAIEKQLKEPSIPLEISSSSPFQTYITSNQYKNGRGKQKNENGDDNLDDDVDKKY